jgi:transmembrane sensor
MTPSAAQPDPAAEERASLWAARLDGSELTASDRATLQAWLDQHPLHRVLLSQYCQLSADLERHLPQLPKEDLLHRSQRRAVGWWGWAAAAAVAVLLAGTFLATSLRPDSAPRSIASSVAQRQELTLADGTRLELNAQTSVRVTFTATERRVRLASGQAFFAVQSEPNRPFIIDTPAGSVHVTGTAFDVRSESAQALEVLVVHGSVQVRPTLNAEEPETVPLQAGQRLRLTGPGTLTVQDLTRDDLADALAWRQGQIVLNGTPLREALERFGRYHGRGLSATAAAGELGLGGRYSLDDLDGFLESLEDLWPVQVVHHLNGTVQVRLRQE